MLASFKLRQQLHSKARQCYSFKHSFTRTSRTGFNSRSVNPYSQRIYHRNLNSSKCSNPALAFLFHSDRLRFISEPAYIVRDGTIDDAKLNLEVCLRSSITRFFIEVLDEGITGTTLKKQCRTSSQLQSMTTTEHHNSNLGSLPVIQGNSKASLGS